MSITPEVPDETPERGVPVKIAREEKRGLYLLAFERFCDQGAAICKLVAGEDQGNFFFCLVATDDRPPANGQGFFFKPGFSFSLAAIR